MHCCQKGLITGEHVYCFIYAYFDWKLNAMQNLLIIKDEIDTLMYVS